jgi:sarcosine oxidase, subunit beta
MRSSASVVVIGGGVIGVSIACHLAAAGVSDVVLVETANLGDGATSKSAGGVRLQFSDVVNIGLAQRSMDCHERFDEWPGRDIGLRQVGYLFLLRREGDVARFEHDVALQQSMGVESRMLTPDEAAALNPLIDPSRVLAASFCARDGYCSPADVVAGYADRARADGAALLTNTTVTGIDVRNGQIAEVRTSSGVIRTNTVICAAGAWSRAIGEMAGVPLDVAPVARPVWFTEPCELPAGMPFTIDFASSLYFHAEGPGLLLGMADRLQPAGFDVPLAGDWLERVAAQMSDVAPGLANVGIAGGWVGHYETTPDDNALLGEAVEVSRFLYAAGFSGHGFQLSPAIGEVIRDLFLGVPPAFDIDGFAAERFARGALRRELNVV